MRNLLGATLLIAALAGCESTARSTVGYGDDLNEGPGRSKIHDLEVQGSGDAAAQPAAAPVRVALVRTNVAPALRTRIEEARLHALWRAHFEKDASMRVVDDEDAVRVTSTASALDDGRMLMSARVGERTLMARGHAANYPAIVRRLADEAKRILRDG